MPSPEDRMGACSLGQEKIDRSIPSTRRRRREFFNSRYAPITVEGSIVTPGPWVEEIAIFFR